jgi:hypothetical protein
VRSNHNENKRVEGEYDGEGERNVVV